MATSAESALTALASSFQRFMKDHQDQMEKVLDRFDNRKTTLTGKSIRDLARRQKMREIELKQAEKGVKAMQRLDDAVLELESSMEKNAEASDEVRETATELANALEGLMKDSLTASKQQREVIFQAHAALQQGNLQGALHGIEQVSKDLGEQEKKRYTQQALIVKTGDLFERQMHSLTEAIKTNVKEFFTLNTAIGLAVGGLTKEFSLLQQSLEHQVPIMDMAGGHFADSAAAYGLSVQELMRTQAAYAQSLLASAGSVDRMSDVSKRFMDVNAQLRQSTYNLTGDLDKGAQLLATAIDAETMQGVHMSMQEVSAEITKPRGLLHNLHEMSIMTGKSAQELLEMNRALMSDYDFRTSMLGLDKKERQARLNELVSIQDTLIKRGMEANSAAEAASALQKLTAQMSPKERYKETMKLAVMARAFGVKGAEQLPALMQDPVRNARAIAEIMTSIQQRQGQMMAAGNNLGVQQMGYMLGQIGGGTQQALAKLSTGGMEGRAVDQGAQQQIADVADKQLTQLTGIQGGVASLKQTLERIAKWFDDPAVGLLGSAVSAVGAVFKDALELLIAKQLISSGGGLIGKGVGGALGGLAARAAPMLGTAGTWAGGVAAAGAAGYGAGTLLNMAPELFGGRDISDYIDDLLLSSKEKKALGQMVYHIDPSKRKKITSLAPMPDQTPASGPTITSSSQNQDPATLLQNQIDALNRLSDVLMAHSGMTDDMKDAIKSHVATMKASIDATKKNTDATSTNTQMTQIADRKSSMMQADPGAGG